jgi:hypothetical protein
MTNIMGYDEIDVYSIYSFMSGILIITKTTIYIISWKEMGDMGGYGGMNSYTDYFFSCILFHNIRNIS